MGSKQRSNWRKGRIKGARSTLDSPATRKVLNTTKTATGSQFKGVAFGTKQVPLTYLMVHCIYDTVYMTLYITLSLNTYSKVLRENVCFEADRNRVHRKNQVLKNTIFSL